MSATVQVGTVRPAYGASAAVQVGAVWLAYGLPAAVQTTSIHHRLQARHNRRVQDPEYRTAVPFF